MTTWRAKTTFLVCLAAGAAGCDDKAGPRNADADAGASALSAAASAIAAPATSGSATGASAGSAASATSATVPDAVAAQHILIAYKGADKAPKGVTRSKADARKRAEEVVGKAKAGTDFSALVSEYSDDPAAKERQGSLGKFTRDKMAKPFSDAAFALKVDEISAPVETPFGYHVIKRNQ